MHGKKMKRRKKKTRRKSFLISAEGTGTRKK
jgi:hypothetical protein